MVGMKADSLKCSALAHCMEKNIPLSSSHLKLPDKRFLNKAVALLKKTVFSIIGALLYLNTNSGDKVQ